MEKIEFSNEEIAEFKAEALELLDQAEEKLLEIDQGKLLSANYDAIFRAFHSIKGASGMLALTSLQDHMHKIESHFQQCKSLANLDKNKTSYFLKAIDATKALLDHKNINFDYSFSLTEEGLKEENKSQIIKDKAPVQNLAVKKEKFMATVMIIDDEPDLVTLISDILIESNYQVFGFNSSVQALEKLTSIKPDLIISDMKMPEMDGLELLTQINKLDPDLPVIFVSGFLTKDVIIEAINYGIYSIIEKPFTDIQIMSIVKSATEKSQLTKLFNKSINFIMYLYSDIDEYLQIKGKEEIRKVMNKDLMNLLESKRNLKNSKIRNNSQNKS